MADNAVVKFNVGEGLFSADFNLLAQNMLHQIHDFALYNKMMGLGRSNSPHGSSDFLANYAANYAAPPIGMRKLVFTPDSYSLYLEEVAGPSVRVHPGVFGVYNKTVAPASESEVFYKVMHSSVPVDLTYGTLPPVGSYRYSTVAVKVDPVETGSVSRDFKDAVTGVLTTQLTNKRVEMQATFRLVHGTDTVGSAFPYPTQGATGTRYPALAFQEHAVGYVLADSTGIQQLFLSTYPMRQGVISEKPITSHGLPNSRWLAPNGVPNFPLTGGSTPGSPGQGAFYSHQAGLTGTRILTLTAEFWQPLANQLDSLEIFGSATPGSLATTASQYNVGRNINFTTTGNQTEKVYFCPELFPLETECLPPIWNTTLGQPFAGLESRVFSVGAVMGLATSSANNPVFRNVWFDMVR